MVSIIIPTLGRTEQCLNCVKRIWQITEYIPVEILVITEDKETQEALRGMCTLIKEGGTAVEKWNKGYEKAIGDWIVLGADDLYFGENWLKIALESKNKGYIGFNDLAPYTGNPTHYMVTVDFVNKVLNGHFIYPEYKAWYFDKEIAEKARKADRFLYLEDCIVEHRHWNWNKAKKDETYKLAEDRIKQDKILYESRNK